MRSLHRSWLLLHCCTAAPLPEAAHARGPTFKTVARQYIDELRAANLEEQKGIEDKEATYAAFVEEFENPRIGFKWIPILLLYTGARPDEIASLPLANVRREKAGREDIDYFAITAGKTSSSLRKVPLH